MTKPEVTSNVNAPQPIRVAIVDDHPVVRDGTAALLAVETGIAVVGVAASLDEAADLVREVEVDVLLLDIRLGNDSGLSLLDGHGLRGVPPARGSAMRDGQVPGAGQPARPAVIVLTAYDYPQYAEAALRLGAAGFVLKTAPISELVDAIRRVAAGGLAFAVRPPQGTLPTLSRREVDVLRLVVEGRSNDEIGRALGIGTKTVETHLGRLFERSGVASRTELATRALREGWLEIPPPA